MEDENALPLSKKRVATREISKDNPGLDDDDDAPEQEMGTFKKASDEVLASRRIVKVRRQHTASAASSPSVPSVNPFASIRLVAPAPVAVSPAEATIEAPAGGEKVNDEVDQTVGEKRESADGSELNEEVLEKKTDVVAVDSAEGEDKVDSNEEAAEAGSAGKIFIDAAAEKAAEPKAAGDGDEKKAVPENADKKAAADDGVEETDDTEPGDGKESESGKSETDNRNSVAQNEDAPLSSFQQLSSSQNAFTGLASTGFSSYTFSFGSNSKDGPQSGSGFLFGSKIDQSSVPSLSFGTFPNGSGSLFGTIGASMGTKVDGSGFLPMQEVHLETGEENEKTVFSADSVLFEYLDGGWKERGKGEVKVNVSTGVEKERARLVMRARGNLRLILNASLYPDMKLANMDKRGISFACVNSATVGNDTLSTFALKFKDVSILESFSSAVTHHRGKAVLPVKTPENSPKASDD
ncbi:hypothetical protein Dimus_004345 [Dionaea muscipula]